MANKFTKSVLERQAKEFKARSAQSAKPAQQQAEPQGALEQAPIPASAEGSPEPQALPAAPAPASEPSAPSEPVEPPASPPSPPQPEPLAEPTETAGEGSPRPRSPKKPAAPLPDLTAFIVKDEGRNAKNKTFYLDEAVIDALHRAAVAQKITDSKLVNDILKKVLGLS